MYELFSVSNLKPFADIVIFVVLVLAIYRMFRLQSAIKVLKGSDKEMRETLVVLTDNVEKSITGVRDVLEESKQTALELGQRLAESDSLMQKADEWRERALEIDQAVAASESLLTELKIVRDSAERTADRLSNEAKTVNTLLSNLRSEAKPTDSTAESLKSAEGVARATEESLKASALSYADAPPKAAAAPKPAVQQARHTEHDHRGEGSHAFLIGAARANKVPKLKSDGKWGNYTD